jgi:hypothetical protein
MSDDADAKLLQVLRRQARENRLVYVILAERSLILSKAKAPQPNHDVHDDAPKRRNGYVLERVGLTLQRQIILLLLAIYLSSSTAMFVIKESEKLIRFADKQIRGDAGSLGGPC